MDTLVGAKLCLDLSRDVFSCRGSNLAISERDCDVRGRGLWLQHIFGGKSELLYRLCFCEKGEEVPCKVEALPHRLRMIGAEGTIEITFSSPQCLRVRGEGASLRLIRSDNDYGGLVEAPEGALRSILGWTKLLFRTLEGQINWEAPWYPQDMFNSIHHKAEHVLINLQLESGSNVFDCLIERYVSETHGMTLTHSFEEDCLATERDFHSWLSRAPQASPEFEAARAHAVQVNWSCVVPPAGNFKWPAMLMSKRGMCKCWNWDNYFNAWASVSLDPDFAWHQYRLHIEHQHPMGALGDAITEESVQFQYTKPPVHGWILKRMIEADRGITWEQAASVYGNLCSWTNWWFHYRDDDKDGICQYNHGNDSGWDNATIFDLEMPVESPDLSALLIVQMDFLAEVATYMGKENEAAEWRGRSDACLDAMLSHFWREDGFGACRSGSHSVPKKGDCLLPHLAIVLGRRLPRAQREQTAQILATPGRFLTDFGLATESLGSDCHLSSGYWRGSIWAPAMLFAIDGLKDAGFDDQSKDLAQRFCRLCSLSGFSENYNPSTGQPLFDPAYTWTASAFLLCLDRYL